MDQKSSNNTQATELSAPPTDHTHDEIHETTATNGSDTQQLATAVINPHQPGLIATATATATASSSSSSSSSQLEHSSSSVIINHLNLLNSSNLNLYHIPTPPLTPNSSSSLSSTQSPSSPSTTPTSSSSSSASSPPSSQQTKLNINSNPLDKSLRSSSEKEQSDLNILSSIDPNRRLSHSNPPSQPLISSIPQSIKPSLQDTLDDLRSLLKTFRKILPLRNRLARFIPKLILNLSRSCVCYIARMLHSRNLLASNVVYDLAILLLKLVINLFFREIKPRGSHKIPSKGPLIFVAAPHHNQFLDPVILMSEVRAAEGARRVSFLTAEKSMKRPFIGLVARVMQSISVTRAADNAEKGSGSIYLLNPEADDLVKNQSNDPSDLTIIYGQCTKFSVEFAPKKQIMLPKSLGFATAEVVEVIDDSRLRVKKPFPSKACEVLREQGSLIQKTKSINDVQVTGVSFKVLPYIDQTTMYGKVYDKLKNGGCLGIFPEGGSHDRTDLLPLKAGVSIMALGAMSAVPDITVRIVPVGLSYFHPHRFRSRAVVEFGDPIEIPQNLVRDFEKGNEDKRAAIGKVMELVYDGLKSVTVQAPDYDTLQVIQAARRLYRPPDRHVSLATVVELNKRFITGYLRYKDEPRVQALKEKTLEYNKALSYLGLKDHQVEKVNRRWWKSLILLFFRAGLVTGWGVLALPGVVLNAPMFICASVISRKKAKEALEASTVKIAGRDVLATWKVLVSLGLAPPLYITYVAIAVTFSLKYNVLRKYVLWTPLAMLIALPSIGYSALKFGEVGMDVYKSLRPLLLSILGDKKQLERVRKMRTELQEELHSVIEEYAPKIWENFQQFRIHHQPSADYGPRLITANGNNNSSSGLRTSKSSDLINHPLNWLDERLFGWSQYDLRQSSENRHERRTDKRVIHGYNELSESSECSDRSGSCYESDMEEDGDYDSVVGMLSRFTGASYNGNGARSRRSSRTSRSRSQLSLREYSVTSSPRQSSPPNSQSQDYSPTLTTNRRRKV
ncbi:hypothetical protein PPACK8108_LOCUS422 [Phakopsora pachyrhizi]|uniref:Phospholipid/glycerol acyltransferase domain-containing protein n=1 Tax=Phakopsora pachyrhizi TaxID=170000 RepID=A0AAV0AHF4_PHAPC|nr:hypothetical protein PPACK8108_LOCUS422 [Phakopsora pachyrhizi]